MHLISVCYRVDCQPQMSIFALHRCEYPSLYTFRCHLHGFLSFRIPLQPDTSPKHLFPPCPLWWSFSLEFDIKKNQDYVYGREGTMLLIDEKYLFRRDTRPLKVRYIYMYLYVYIYIYQGMQWEYMNMYLWIIKSKQKLYYVKIKTNCRASC